MIQPSQFRNPILLLTVMLLSAGCAEYGGHPTEVSFVGARGDVLRGTLLVPPNAPGPVPAVVLLHGAEKATRERIVYPVYANVFLQRGIAVLVYDKRGAGDSGGSYEDSTYADLVADAVAAVALLRQQPAIDPARIGLLGASESAWLTPEIAERSGGIAFVINKSGSPLSWRDTVAWEVYNDLMDDGVPEPSAREQTSVQRRIWSYYIAPSPEERAALEAVLASWTGREHSQLPATLAAEVSPSYVEDVSYDPTPFLARLDVPMLYLFGDEDINIPVDASVARLRELAATGRPVSFHVFEDAGHELGGPSLSPPFYAPLEGVAERFAEFATTHTSTGSRLR